MSRAPKKFIIMLAVVLTAIVAHAEDGDRPMWGSSGSAQTQPATAPQTQSSGRAMWGSGSAPNAQPQSQPQNSGRAMWSTQPSSASSTQSQSQSTSAQPSSRPAARAMWGATAPAATTAPQAAPQAATTFTSQPPAVVAAEKKRATLQSDAGVECKDCRPDELERLRRMANTYAEMESRSLVSRGVAKVMNVTYQRCDADNDSMLVPPTYYNPGFHNDDSKDGGADNRYHGYQGASEMQPGDMWSGNTDDKARREWFDLTTMRKKGTFFMKTGGYAPGCRDMSKTPVVFCDGGRSSFAPTKSGQAYINVFNNKPRPTSCKGATDVNCACASPDFVTFDCSDFVSSVYIATGLKFYKNRPASTPITTRDMLGFLKPNANSCIGPASFNKGKSLESGDLIVFDSHHSMIVDTVGADPFGLKKLPAATPCTEIDPDNFNITIAQAGVFGGRMGPSRIRYQDLLTTNGMIDERKAALLEFAIKACEVSRSGVAANASVRIKDADGENEGAHILRPVGLKDPDCYVHKPSTHPDCAGNNRTSYACQQPWGAKMKGEECLDNCGLDASGDAQ